MAEKKADVMLKKGVILAAVSALMLAGYFIIRAVGVSGPERGEELDHDHGGYITYLELAEITSAEFTPPSGKTFTITAKDGGFYLGEDCNAEELFYTVSCAATLPYLSRLGAPTAPLSDYGLDPPDMTVRILTADGMLAFSVGGAPPDTYSRYVLCNGGLYLVDAEVAGQLALPENAYRLRTLWPGEQGERPTLTEISTANFTVVRREVADDAPLSVSRYELTSPVSFPCIDDAVSEKIMNGLLAIDLDEIAEDVVFEQAGTVTIKSDGFERTLYVGGEVPDGGRYLILDGDDTVYIDRFGGYGFLDVMPLDLTYGRAFWLYRLDDVKKITVVENGRARSVPEETAEINLRRFFSHLLNFSVVELALTGEIDKNNRVTLEMNDGSVHELCLTKQNERQLAVSVDGENPVFACNIKDWQQVLNDLDTLEAGGSIKEDT